MKLLVVAILFATLYVNVFSESYWDEGTSVTYHVWVEDEITERHKTRVAIPLGSIFYNVMERAARKHNVFDFESRYYVGVGHFITKIGDDEQIPLLNKYWLLFITNTAPSPSSPPGQSDLSPLGVSSLVIENGKHYLFWLRTANFTHT